MKVLVVDDSTTMRKIVAMALGSAGHTFEEAENGKKALEKIVPGKFDLVLLDVNMPEMNGIEFLEAKGKNAAISSIPVIMLTTQDEMELQQKAISLGAKAFMIKPFKKEELLSTIGTVVSV